MAILDDSDALALLNLDATDPLLPLVRSHAEKLCKAYMGWDPERSEVTEYYPLTERGGARNCWLGDWGSRPSTGGRTAVLQLKRKWVLASGLAVSEYAGAYMGQSDQTDWTDLALGTDFILDLDDDNVSESGHLVNLGGAWPKQRGSVKVVYTAGFTATELDGTKTGDTDYTDASDLRLAVMMAVAKVYNELKSQQKNTLTHAAGPVVSERLPDYQYAMEPVAARALMGMSMGLPPACKEILHRYTNRYSLVI